MRWQWRIPPAAPPSAEATADLILISRLACDSYNLHHDGQLARALLEQPELAGITWPWLLQREPLLREEGPLFAETRTSITQRLRGSHRRRALSIARRFHAELSPEVEAILQNIAQAFHEKLPKNLPPVPAPRYARFSDPTNTDDVPLHTALQLGNHQERQLLLTKLQGARDLLNSWGSSWSVTQLGYRIPLGALHFRADVLLQRADEPPKACRIIAPMEALHPAERNLLDELGPSSTIPSIVFVPMGSLLGPDEMWLANNPKWIVERTNA